MKRYDAWRCRPFGCAPQWRLLCALRTGTCDMQSAMTLHAAVGPVRPTQCQALGNDTKASPWLLSMTSPFWSEGRWHGAAFKRLIVVCLSCPAVAEKHSTRWLSAFQGGEAQLSLVVGFEVTRHSALPILGFHSSPWLLAFKVTTHSALLNALLSCPSQKADNQRELCLGKVTSVTVTLGRHSSRWLSAF